MPSSIDHETYIVNQIEICLEVLNINDINDIHDIIHNEIDNYVSNNSINENKDIINNYHDDIYDAIYHYRYCYDIENIINKNDDKTKFYAILAYMSLEENIIDNHISDFEKKLNVSSNENSSDDD